MQVILNGLIGGLAIALLAVAFQLVYLPTRIFFLGLAGLYSLAPYLFLACQDLKWPWAACLIITLTLAVALSLFFEWANHAPLSRKGASDSAHLISSLGFYIVLVQFVAMTWGNNIKTIRPGVDSTIAFADVVLTGSQLLMAGVSCCVLFAFYATLNGTGFGLRLRALADNPNQFALFGYDVYGNRLAAFALAGLFSTVSALLTAYDIGFTPHAGLQAVLLAVVAVIIGGRISFVGPLIGGLLLGVMRSEITWQFSSRWQDVLTFAVLAIFLLFKPEGILGKKGRIEALA